MLHHFQGKIDMEQSEYKWAGNSDVNATWTSEVGEQFEYMYRLFFFVFLLKTVMFFLCIAEHYSIINPVLLHKFKGYNKENGKPDESLGRKARRG